MFVLIPERAVAAAFAVSAFVASFSPDNGFCGDRRPGTELVVPSVVTAYDVSTPRELFYRRHVAPFVDGSSVETWSLWEDLEQHVGEWIRPYIEAQRIASTIQDAFPVGGQQNLGDLNQLTADCSGILGLKPPEVFIRNSPLTIAYVTEIDGRPMLTVTSGLLALYEDRPAELRFVVGRELGRIRCGHVPLRAKAYAVFAALQGINVATVPDKYQLVLPTLALGRLMSLFREMEFSADRAGLLCCQDRHVAFQAMLRQLHGLRAGSAWIDPESPDFDPDEYLRQIKRLEDRPLVALIQDVHGHATESPFVPERIAQLAVWSESEAYREILSRTDKSRQPDLDQLVTIESITVRQVADDTANPYIIAYTGDKKFVTTVVAEDKASVRWSKLNATRGIVDGQPIFFEIWNDNWGTDTLLGGFVVYPRNPSPGKSGATALLKSPIEWDWQSRTTTTRQGLGEVKLGFSHRAKETK